MDSTETFAVMCEAAQEIQQNWQPQCGDWVASASHTLRRAGQNRNVRVVEYMDDDRPIIHSRQFNKMMDAKHRGDLIWLPRQDQLQEMIGGDNYQTFWNLVVSLSSEEPLDQSPYAIYDETAKTSLEQVWIRYVMSEKFHKFWNGITWEREAKK